MKTLIYVLGILIAMLLANQTFGEKNDSSKVVKTIIKTIEINDDGETTIDTIVFESNEYDVLMKNDFDFITKRMHHQKGAKNKAMKKYWIDDDDEIEYNITIETDGDSSKVFVMRSPNDIKKEIILNKKFGTDLDFIMFDDDDLPLFHKEHKIKRVIKSNQIDLNDPSIISFEKEETKNGNEKITIVRKKQE